MTKLKDLIQEYLLDENLLRGKVKDQKLEFGFKFVFPGGADPTGRPRGRNLTVTKPKNRDFIEIGGATIISPVHVKVLKGDKKKRFFIELQKYLLTKSFFFNLDLKNNRYVIIDNIFPEKDGTISKDSFFRSVRNIFTSTVYSIILLKEHCDEGLDLSDWELK